MHFHIPKPSLHSKLMSSQNLTAISFFRASDESLSASGRNILSLPEVQMLELLLAVFVFVVIHSLRQKKWQGVPSWPLFGMLPSLAMAVQSDLYEWLTEVLRRQNGTFLFRGPWLGSLNGVVTCDPRNLEHLLKTKFPIYPKGAFFRDTVQDLLGDGIFGADDETWQRQRKVASLEFHSSKFRCMMTGSLRELVHARLLPVLETNSFCEESNTRAIDLQDVLLRLTFDNVCMIAFGVDPGCLRPKLPEIPFARDFEDATEATLLRFVTPQFIWKAMRWVGLGTERRLKESIKGIDKFADEVIRTRKKELVVEGEKNERSDLLTVFIGMKDEEGRPFSEKFLRDICVNFILAGRDTSSVALSWFFWLLDKNPGVEERIVAEIRRIAGEREEGEGEKEGGFVFRPEEVKKMDYLQAALSEALRLYPSVPLDHKEVVEDDVFPDGTVLKRGTKVVYAIYAMGRMESIWGKDCREYRPERWLREGRFTSESAYKFTAFNGGPRLCLGKDFAYYQMKFVAASVLYRFHVRVVENHPVKPKLALTMYMKHGLKVVLSRREEFQLHHKYLTKTTS